jgi:hypothetical protein
MFDKIKDAVGGSGDLQKYVEDIDFPASKEQIIDQLQRSGAKDDIIAKVRELGQEQFKDQGDLINSVLGKA